MVILTMDNGACNDYKKLTVNVPKKEIDRIAKNYFSWRSSTKKYKTIEQRIKSLGSKEYDLFILHCKNLGY